MLSFKFRANKPYPYYPPRKTMIELIITLLFEFMVQILGEVLFEMGLHSLANIFSKKRASNPAMAMVGYMLFGMLLGALSVWLLPLHFVIDPFLQKLNLLITPVLSGLIMSLIGYLRLKNGQSVLRLDKFSYGFLFALAFALTRYYWAK